MYLEEKKELISTCLENRDQFFFLSFFVTTHSQASRASLPLLLTHHPDPHASHTKLATMARTSSQAPSPPYVSVRTVSSPNKVSRALGTLLRPIPRATSLRLCPSPSSLALYIFSPCLQSHIFCLAGLGWC